MARLIIGSTNVESKTTSRFGIAPLVSSPTLQGPKLQQRLRQKRSKTYVDEVSRLSAATYKGDTNALEELIGSVEKEFADLGISQYLIGLIWGIWVPDEEGRRVKRYDDWISGRDFREPKARIWKSHEAMPSGGFEEARRLALHGSYAAVEVWSDALRAVALDGSVSVIEI